MSTSCGYEGNPSLCSSAVASTAPEARRVGYRDRGGRRVRLPHGGEPASSHLTACSWRLGLKACYVFSYDAGRDSRCPADVNTANFTASHKLVQQAAADPESGGRFGNRQEQRLFFHGCTFARAHPNAAQRRQPRATPSTAHKLEVDRGLAVARASRQPYHVHHGRDSRH